jgi:hypothetical protein
MQKLATICLAATLTSAAGRAQAGGAGATFDFQSSFWVNLHHFLYQQAASDAPPSDDSGAWNAAMNYYRGEILPHNSPPATYLLDRKMEEINNGLAASESARSLKESGLSPGFIAILENAAPIYRERWWPEHNRANLAWVAAVRPLLDQHAAALKEDLAKVFGARWQGTAIRTDITQYAGLGAYTTLGPTHITVSSADPANAGQAGLEILFHEASHALIRPIRDALSREAQAQKSTLRRPDTWHALLFYTTGEIVKRRLDGYVPYAIKGGLYERAWLGALAVFEQDWKPYLESKTDRDTAVRRVVADYSAPR